MWLGAGQRSREFWPPPCPAHLAPAELAEKGLAAALPHKASLSSGLLTASDSTANNRRLRACFWFAAAGQSREADCLQRVQRGRQPGENFAGTPPSVSSRLWRQAGRRWPPLRSSQLAGSWRGDTHPYAYWRESLTLAVTVSGKPHTCWARGRKTGLFRSLHAQPLFRPFPLPNGLPTPNCSLHSPKLVISLLSICLSKRHLIDPARR
jgi:hypothetical protein